MRSLLINISVTLLIMVSQIANSHSANAEATTEELQCEKAVKTTGPGNQIESMAKLQTIITWSETVKTKYTGDHSQWHYAREKRVSCKRADGSRYFYCQISAAPCRLVDMASDKKATDPETEPTNSIEQADKIKGKAANRRAALERARAQESSLTQ